MNCRSCAHYYSSLGFCSKYEKQIIVSRNLLHYSLLIHPLDCLTIYYDTNYKKDIEHLIELSEKYLKDGTSKSICLYYRKNGYISYKQRKFLLYKIFDCYELK